MSKLVEYDFVNVPIVDIVNRMILYASQHKRRLYDCKNENGW